MRLLWTQSSKFNGVTDHKITAKNTTNQGMHESRRTRLMAMENQTRRLRDPRRSSRNLPMNSNAYIAGMLVAIAALVAFTPPDRFAFCGASATIASLIGIHVTNNSAMDRRILVGTLAGALIGWVAPYIIMWAVIAYASLTGVELMPVPN